MHLISKLICIWNNTFFKLTFITKFNSSSTLRLEDCDLKNVTICINLFSRLPQLLFQINSCLHKSELYF